MTDRTLPPVAVGVRPRPAFEASDRPAPASRTVPAARVGAARREAVLTTPARAGILLGASAAVYAVTLAGVATMQSGTDASIHAARAPQLDVVAEMRAGNDVLEARVRNAYAAVASLADDYALIGTDIAAYQARLDELAALVADVQGSAAALPTRIKLPSVSIAGPVAASRGGGGSVSAGRGGGGGGSNAPKTSGKSGASGG